MRCYVYWIKRKRHTNPEEEGYVGISNDPQRRFGEHHLSEFKVGNAIRKYKDVEMIILHECADRNEALLLESKYRPSNHIGWNVICGGGEPPRNHLDEKTRNKISETLKNKGCSPYSSKTHSAETIAKSNKTKKEKKYKWFHDPKTLESFCLPTNKEVPSNLVLGRIPKKEKIIKENKGNTKQWKVVSPSGKTFYVENLKTWCKQKSIPYLATFKNGWKGWRCYKDTSSSAM